MALKQSRAATTATFGHEQSKAGKGIGTKWNFLDTAGKFEACLYRHHDKSMLVYMHKLDMCADPQSSLDHMREL